MEFADTRLSSWTGEFLDQESERAYRAESWPRLCHSLRVIAILAAGLYIAMLYLNWKGFGDNAAFRTVATLRIGTAISLLGMALASRPSWPQRRVHVFFCLTIFCMTATRLIEDHFAAEQVRRGGAALAQTFPIMPMIIFAVLAIPMRLVLLWSGVGALLILRAYARTAGFGSPLMALMLLNLAFALGVLYFLRLALDRIARRDFVLRRDLERAEAEARHAAEAKGRFLAVMSHEIRTPLNGVLGGVQLLEDTALAPEQRQPLELVARNGEQLALLLDDVLDLARIEAGRLVVAQEPFAPAELLAGVHAALYTQARAKGLALRVEHGSLPAGLVGDALRLRQVLINLVGNAVKFTEAGEVALRLDCDERPAGTMRCAFTVRDTGPGLDAKAQARVFAPFEQGDMSIQRRHGGVGLGLALCRELVAAMGSELRLESRPGSGCTFTFAVNLPEAAEPAPIAAMAQGPSLSILVVDDVEANCIVAEGLLRSLGHRPGTAASGAAALEALRRERFDAVLVDLHMPDMDGLELCRRIRDLDSPAERTLPVLLVSADTEPSRIEACLRAGMTGTLAKPLRKARLAAALAGVAAASEPAPPPEAPLVDTAYTARIVADLGRETWAKGLRACRESALESLTSLGEPERKAPALHRLKGLAASYGLLALQARVADLERREALPAGWIGDLEALTRSSLEALGADAEPSMDPPSSLAPDPPG